MDLTPINEALGLASSAVGLTGKAASTIAAIKGLFDGGKTPDSGEASKLLNELATELTMANMTNVQLSQALKTLSRELLRQDEFEREKSRYAMFETSTGDIVFKLRDEFADGQPIHYICPVCMTRDRLITYITGENDFKRCQTDNNHMYRFRHSPLPQVKAGRGWT